MLLLLLLCYLFSQDDELALSAAVQEAQVKVHEAFVDNINTAGALDALSGLIKATNLYLAGKQQAAAAAAAAADGADASGLLPAGPQPLLLRKAAAFMTRILSVMGVLPVSYFAEGSCSNHVQCPCVMFKSCAAFLSVMGVLPVS
jgi:hypothetical protein